MGLALGVQAGQGAPAVILVARGRLRSPGEEGLLTVVAVAPLPEPLVVDRVGGDAVAERVVGDVRLRAVGGDLVLHKVTGLVETTFFPKTYDRFCHMIEHQRPYLLLGKVQEDWGAVTLTVDKVDRISI